MAKEWSKSIPEFYRNPNKLSKNQSTGQQAFKGGVWAAFLSYFSNFIGLVTGLVLARLLFKEDFGLFAFGLALAEIIIVLTGMSFSVAAIKHQDLDDVFETACALSFIQAVGIVILSSIIGGVLYFSSYENLSLIFILIGFSMAVQVPANLYGATLEKEFKFKQEALIRASTRILSCVFCLILAYIGMGPWSLVAREVFFAVILFVIFYFLFGRKLKFKINKDSAKILIKTSIRLLKLRISEVFSMKLPHLVIGGIGGRSMLGSVERSQYLSSIPHVILTPFTSKVAFPYFAKVKSATKISKGLSIISYICTKLLLPIVIFSVFYADQIVLIALGADWVSAAPYYRALTVYLLIIPLIEVFKQALIVRGRELAVTFSNIFCIVIFSLIALLVYVQSYNLEYLVWGISFSFLGGFLLMFFYSKQNGLKIDEVNLKSLLIEVSALTAVTYICYVNGIPFYIAFLLTGFTFLILLFLFEKKLLSIFKELYSK